MQHRWRSELQTLGVGALLVAVADYLFNAQS